jgi:hypothetical protein
MNASARPGNGAAYGARRRGAGRDAPIAPCPPVSPGGHGVIGTSPGAPGGRAARRDGAANGAANGAVVVAAPSGVAVDADYVIYRLEEAGQTLLALPSSGWTTHLRESRIDVVRSAIEGYGWERSDGPLRPAVPGADRIDRMDEALGWIPLIPRDRYVLRRIVGAGSLVSPVTERHLFTWRRLGALLGADHKAIQRWHGQGILLIVAALNGRGG